MNTIFISNCNITLKSFIKNFSVENIFIYLFKSYIRLDKLNNKQDVNNISLKIDKELIKNFDSKRKYRFRRKILYNLIISRIRNLNIINLVYSNYFDEYESIKKKINNHIYDVLSDNIKITEIIAKNEMQKNDKKYLSRFFKDTKFSIDKVKILFIVSKYSDLFENKLKEYIEKYRYIDVLKLNISSKYEKDKINSTIDNINYEYGSNIDFITNKNISNYNILLYNLDENLPINIFNDYILPNKYQKIDFFDVENDKYNTNIVCFFKNKNYLSELFNRLNISYQDYSKNKLRFYL